MKLNKRILSLMLALVLIFGMVPTALATDGGLTRKQSSKPTEATEPPTEAPIETTVPAQTETPETDPTLTPEETIMPDSEIDDLLPAEILEIDESVYNVVITADSKTSTFSLRNRNIELTSSVATAEEAHALSNVPTTNSNHNRVWSGLYRIEASAPTTISMSNLPEIDGKVVEVRHFLDNADAVRGAIENGTARFYGTEDAGLSKELAAVEEATDGEIRGEICFEILSSENEDVLIDGNSVSFYAETYSLFEISIVFVEPKAVTQAAEVDNIGSGAVDSDAVVTDKNVEATDDGYNLILESYVTGSKNTTEVSKTVPSDIVLTVDLSASMEETMDGCSGGDGHTGNTSKHKVKPSQLDKNTPYYRSTDKTNPVYYCADCEKWFDTKHTSGSHGGTWYVPFATRGTQTGTAFYIERENINSLIDGTQVDITKGYYFTTGGKWYYTQYCPKCEGWINCDWLKPNENGDHSGSGYGHFNADGTVSENGSHDGGSNWHPLSSHYTFANFYKACYTNRLAAAKIAMNAFLNQVYESAKGPDGKWGGGDDVEHRVAITAFSGLYSYWGTAQTTGVYSVYDESNPNRFNTFYPYYQLEDEFNGADSSSGYYGNTNNKEPYKYSLRTVTKANERDILQNAVDILAIQYGTNTDYGVNMAKSIFQNNPTANRTKMFVVFTDGVPDRGIEKAGGQNYGIWGNTGAAEPSLQYSHDLKESGVTVYSIGIMSGADARLKDTIRASTEDANNYMHLLSSNYPDADTMHKEYTKADLNSSLKNADGSIKDYQSGYYLSASNSEELVDAFVSIAEQIPDGGADIQLGSTTEVRDYITDDFYIPEGAVVSVHTETYGGDDASGNKIWTKDNNSETFTTQVDGNAVTVSGFDFSANYVGTDVSTDLNGNITRTPHGKKLVVTIPVKTTSIGGNDLTTNTSLSGIYMINNEEDPSDDIGVEYFPIPQVDVPTTVTVKKNVIGKMHVESFGFKSNTYTFDNYSIGIDDNGSPIIGNGPAKDLTALATAKESSHTLKNGEFFTIEDVRVGTEFEITETNAEKYNMSVIVKDAEDHDITATVKPVISGSKITVSSVFPGMVIEVTNTSKTANLTITKVVLAEDAPEQSFLFEVIGDGKTIPVVIPYSSFVNGTASVTLNELEIGDYTINEKANWSWRYDLKSVTASVDSNATKNGNGITVQLTPDNETVTFTNERTNEYWLDGEHYAKNVFTGVKN